MAHTIRMMRNTILLALVLALLLIEAQSSLAAAAVGDPAISSGNNESMMISDETCLPCNQCILEEDGRLCSSGGPDSTTTNSEEEKITAQVLMLDAQGIIDMVAWNARDYYEYTNGRVSIEIKLAPTMPALFEEIENDAKSGTAMFDAYYTSPVILGTAAMLGGFLDLSPYIKSSPYADWTDVLLALRTHVTSFEDKTHLILLDGDTHTMFYRKDILEYFNFTHPPRTWNEYNYYTRTIHGHVDPKSGKQMSGSCVSRMEGDHFSYFVHLVLSSITQTQGTQQGSLFDTKDMTPLLGEAAAEMLRIHEEQAKYGTPDEFDKGINDVQNGHMNEGSCAMTFMWGDLFRRSKAEGSVLHDKLGIAPTPGSELVLNRESGKLEPCTRESCPYAKYYDDIGFVNEAPYAANGGWGGAISANTSPEKQKALAEFFLWAASRQQSEQYVIPNATLPISLINGQDPFRKSQLDVDKWVAKGFDRQLSKQYVDSVWNNLISKNVVVEGRFPKNGEVMTVLDKEVHKHLMRVVKIGLVPEDFKQEERLRVAQTIEDQWKTIIRTYNDRADTVMPILETYQRLRGVYVPDIPYQEMNYIPQGLLALGYTMFAIMVVLCIGAAIWIRHYQNHFVVRVSQKRFMILVILGCTISSLSIVFMGAQTAYRKDLDIESGLFNALEENPEISRVDASCMADPWLYGIGFVITFSGLLAKLARVRLIYKANKAQPDKHTEVGYGEVGYIFVSMLAIELAILVSWQVASPLRWEREVINRERDFPTESVGSCSSSYGQYFYLGLVGFHVICLFLGLILCYETRNVHSDFAESTSISIAVATMFQILILAIPILALVQDNPGARFFAKASAIFLTNFAVMFSIFLPKVKKVLVFDAEGKKETKEKLPLGALTNSKWDKSIDAINGLLNEDSTVYKAMTEEERKQLAEARRLMLAGNAKTRDKRLMHLPLGLMRRNKGAGSKSRLGVRDSQLYIAREFGGVDLSDASTVSDASEVFAFTPEDMSEPEQSLGVDGGSYMLPEFMALSKESQHSLCRLLSWSSLGRWDFNIFDIQDITGGNPLLFVGWATLGSPHAQFAMQKVCGEDTTLDSLDGYDFFGSELKIPPQTLFNYLRVIQEEYISSNPYHNETHAADVLQSLHAMIQMMGSSIQSTTEELFSILIAAAVHDVDHPGLNNGFQQNAWTDTALIHNDISILENHHVSVAFWKMVRGSAPPSFQASQTITETSNHLNILCNVKGSHLTSIRKKMISAILHTDMSKHFQTVNDIKAYSMEEDCMSDKDCRWDVLSYMLHLADISNQAKVRPLSTAWRDRVLDEFFAQGDKEGELGLPVSMLCDRRTTDRSRSQVDFINFVIRPAYEVLAKIIPAVGEQILPIIDDNKRYYENEGAACGSSEQVADTA